MYSYTCIAYIHINISTKGCTWYHTVTLLQIDFNHIYSYIIALIDDVTKVNESSLLCSYICLYNRSTELFTTLTLLHYC